MLIKELEKSQQEVVLNELISRFNFHMEIFNNFSFYKNKSNIYVCSKGAVELAKAIPNVQDLGFAFARLGANVKITTNIVQMIGKFARKNFVEVSEKEARQFISGKDLELDKEQISNATNGFVIIRFGEDSLGVGFLRDKSLKNLLPGAKVLPSF